MPTTPNYLPWSSHRIIGVDDFAFKRGQTYGTVMSIWRRARQLPVADLSARTLATWLESRTEIEIISLDRPTEFERGIIFGALKSI